MTGLDELRARSARRTTLLACALNTLGSPLDLLIGDGHAVPRWPIIATSGVGLILVLVLLVGGRRASAATSASIFLANSLAIAGSLWLTNSAYVDAVGPAFHYEANKLGALAVALLAPVLSVGVASIAAFAGGAAAHALLLPPRLREPLYAEPWASLAYGIFAVALLVYHDRRRILEWTVVAAQAEAAATARLARTIMAIRDLANTPLQTIELAAALLRLRGQAEPRTLQRIGRALQRLRELDAVLASNETRLRGLPRAEAVDPVREGDSELEG